MLITKKHLWNTVSLNSLLSDLLQMSRNMFDKLSKITLSQIPPNHKSTNEE